MKFHMAPTCGYGRRGGSGVMSPCPVSPAAFFGKAIA